MTQMSDITIVLIDDDCASDIIVEHLTFRGFNARRVNSAEAAFQSLEDIASANLVVLDIIMERPPNDTALQISGDRTTGMALFTALRKKNAHLPILILSATRDRDLIDLISNTPQTWFLPKWDTPSLKDITDRIERIIGGSSPPQLPHSFIVHGHDTVEKLALKNYLQNNLGFPEPIILHEQPNLGRTIIEKFEDYASRVDIIFVLLTPDDTLSSEHGTNDEKRRARQNVIFELGYFLGAFGRLSGRVFLLYKGTLDLPSDLAGVIYINISNGIDAAGEILRRELDNVIQRHA